MQMKNHYETNLEFLDLETQTKLKDIPKLGELVPTKSPFPSLKIDSAFLHSRIDPILESSRLVSELPDDGSERIYLFLGAGLGYSVWKALEKKNITCIWVETELGILKHALEFFDYGPFLKNERLIVLPWPISEEKVYASFKGKGTHPITFIQHRGSLSWKEESYKDLNLQFEAFFQKKDINIATLSKFEKNWTKNIFSNFAELLEFAPVSQLFGKFPDVPIVVAGAGPSLFESLKDLKKYRKKFLLIAVDTSLKILQHEKIVPDLVYSVDPQALNSYYLEGYREESILVFDPTSSYLSLRGRANLKKGFVTSSPFPLMKLLEDNLEEELGQVPFGGSVSTNSVSLAKLMGGEIFLVGQDLSFSFGLAHAKGAILEERLSFKESRIFRRELHNHRQLTALPPHFVKSKSGEMVRTNEKLLLFQKWFEQESTGRNWKNLSQSGLPISGIPYADFMIFENKSDVNFSETLKQTLKPIPLNREKFLLTLRDMQTGIKKLLPISQKAKFLAKDFYFAVQSKNGENVQNLLKKLNALDEELTKEKSIHSIISSSLQRVILAITEGYDHALNVEEKKDPMLSVAKKSLLLYEGLETSLEFHAKECFKAIARLSRSFAQNR